jgi:hypothetical protein
MAKPNYAFEKRQKDIAKKKKKEEKQQRRNETKSEQSPEEATQPTADKTTDG